MFDDWEPGGCFIAAIITMMGLLFLARLIGAVIDGIYGTTIVQSINSAFGF